MSPPKKIPTNWGKFEKLWELFSKAFCSVRSKPVCRVTNHSVVEIANAFYFVGGNDEIYFLDSSTSDDFAKKLNQVEIEDLPERIQFDGPPSQYDDD